MHKLHVANNPTFPCNCTGLWFDKKKREGYPPLLFLYFLYHFIIALTVAFITGYAMGEEVKRGWVPI